MQEYLELAWEGCRRVKEQLKKMGAFEYYQPVSRPCPQAQLCTQLEVRYRL